ncbi:hypothetical protein AN219_22050, partial [Streptomyces nanshensis]
MCRTPARALRAPTTAPRTTAAVPVPVRAGPGGRPPVRQAPPATAVPPTAWTAATRALSPVWAPPTGA